MPEIDNLLASLAREPVSPALDGMDARVLARIGERPSPGGAGFGMAAVIAAVLIGIVGGGVPAVTAQARPSLAPLGPSAALTPAALLTGVR